LLSHLRLSWGGLIVILIGWVVLMNLPRRGEWIAGGWDPGVYVNQGVAIAERGGFNRWLPPVFTELTETELAAFTRRHGRDFVECYPGGPLKDGRAQAYFFNATPLVIATAQHAGGLRLATRANAAVGLLAVIMFAAVVLTATHRPAWALGAGALFLIQPLFLYHLHTPVAEVLELFVIGAAGLLCVWRPADGGRNGWLAVLLLLGIVNRISFLPLAALWLVALAWLDLDRPDRGRVRREHLLGLSALITGLAMDLGTSAMPMRLTHVLPQVFFLTGLLAGVTLILDIAANWPRWPLPVLKRRLLLAAVGLLILAGIAGLIFKPASLLGAGRELFWNLWHLLPYLGWPLLVACTCGLALALLARSSAPIPRDLLGIGLVLLLAGVCLLANKWIADLYPWATRRFLIILPVLAFLAAIIPAWLWRRGGWLAKGLAVLAFALLLAGLDRQSSAAWARTEYDGLSGILGRVAERLDPDDVVVTDNSFWAMPLTCIYGRQALDGSALWKEPDSDRARAGWSALERLRGAGRRVRFVTTTSRGIGIYGGAAPAAACAARLPPAVLEEIIHSPRATGFATRAFNAELRIYEW
jgi:hypothetical protein